MKRGLDGVQRDTELLEFIANHSQRQASMWPRENAVGRLDVPILLHKRECGHTPIGHNSDRAATLAVVPRNVQLVHG